MREKEVKERREIEHERREKEKREIEHEREKRDITKDGEMRGETEREERDSERKGIKRGEKLRGKDRENREERLRKKDFLYYLLSQKNPHISLLTRVRLSSSGTGISRHRHPLTDIQYPIPSSRIG